MHKPRAWNRKNIKKYIEIFIKTEIRSIISIDKKKIYKKNINVVGVNIKPQFPKNPDITIHNTFKRNFDSIEKELIKKIKKVILKKRY